MKYQAVRANAGLEMWDGPQPTYRINLTLAVTDADALWLAAMAKGLQTPGMDVDAIMEVLGPREDPSIADCIAMLTAPGVMPGCAVSDYWIDHVPAPAWLPVGQASLPGTVQPAGRAAAF